MTPLPIKITQLDSATSIADTDLMPIVQDVPTTPETKKATVTLWKATLKAYFDTLYSGGGGGSQNYPAQCRLSLSSASAVTTSDVTDASAIHLHPFNGDQLALYSTSGSSWETYTVTSASCAVPATTTTNFDVFSYVTGSTIAIETTDWTNDTTRATALTTQNGIYVKSTDKSRRYLGTGRTTGTSGKCEDSVTKRFLQNYYNAKTRDVFVTETTDHNYNGAERKWNNSDTNNKLEIIIGIQEEAIMLGALADVLNGTSVARATVYVNGSSYRNFRMGGGYSANIEFQLGASILADLSAGYHYIQMYEFGNSASSEFVRMAMSIGYKG